MRLTICDTCGAEITLGPIYKAAHVEADYCSMECRDGFGTGQPKPCPHEENITDAANGRDTARLICKACGYDRVEAVEAIKV